MKSFMNALSKEMDRTERLNPKYFTESKLISARIALNAGIEPAMVCKMLHLQLRDIKHLVKTNPLP